MLLTLHYNELFTNKCIPTMTWPTLRILDAIPPTRGFFVEEDLLKRLGKSALASLAGIMEAIAAAADVKNVRREASPSLDSALLLIAFSVFNMRAGGAVKELVADANAINDRNLILIPFKSFEDAH